MKTRSFGLLSPGDEDMSAYHDEQLVLEALGDSHLAFEQLVEQYQYRLLRTIASIVNDEQAAQDIAQETFLSAWSNLEKLNEGHKFGRWLNQIAINFSRRWLRDQRMHQEKTASLNDMVSLTQERGYQVDKLRREVWDAIDSLTAEHGEAVILYYISGYSYKEISGMLSVPVSTVQGRLQQARNQLRREFLDMVTKLQLEFDSTVHKFLKERAKQDGVSIEGLIIRLIERYKMDISNPEVAVRQVWESSREPLVSDCRGAPSPDGRYLSFTNWRSMGNLAIRDLVTGGYRDLTDEAGRDGPLQRSDLSRWSPDGVQIAYSWFNGGHWEVRIVRLDGSEPRILYRSESKPFARVFLFAWSQDGKYILAYTRDPDDASDIALISVKDGSARILRTLKSWSQLHRMSLSPDGRYVVYDRPEKEHEEARDIFLLATDGSGEEIPLIEHSADDYGPMWAPDGKSIIFVSDRSGAYDAWFIKMADGRPVGEPSLIKRDIGAIHPMGFTREGSLYYGLRAYSTDVYTTSIDPATGELLEPPAKAIRRFEGFNYSPAWSPDGRNLAYASLRPLPGSSRRKPVLVIHSEETDEERELRPEIPLTDVGYRPNIHWSPDGRSILCGRTLKIIDTQTGDVTPITQQPDPNSSIRGAVWAPDGKAIFYTRYTDMRNRYWSIIVHDLETGKEKEVYQGNMLPGLAISPDGRFLVFQSGGLSVIPAAGGEPRIFHRLQAENMFAPTHTGTGLSWTPDGRYVLFETRNVAHSGPTELWRVSAEGGEAQKLLEMDGLTDISVHPDGQHIAFTVGSTQLEVWAMENFLTLD